jgi:hypothetical protein
MDKFSSASGPAPIPDVFCDGNPADTLYLLACTESPGNCELVTEWVVGAIFSSKAQVKTFAKGVPVFSSCRADVPLLLADLERSTRMYQT